MKNTRDRSRTLSTPPEISTPDSKLWRRVAPWVRGSEGSAWIKLNGGRFLALSTSFAEKLQVSPEDAHRILDLDLFTSQEVRRFRRQDEEVLAAGRPGVFLEPPDSASPGRWLATLKVPISEGNGLGSATLALSRPLDFFEPLRDLAHDRRRSASGPEAMALPDRLRASLDRLFQSQFRVPDLAHTLGCHPDHLARSFRRSYGVTIAQYVAARKVAWAAVRLRQTARPIATIAVDAGFHDQSHLNRIFRQILGTTPARYRRAARSLDIQAIQSSPRQALELARSRDPRAPKPQDGQGIAV